MKLRDPCKKCLVRAACKKGCEDNYDFHNTRYFIIGRFCDLCLATAIVTILATIIGVL